MNNVLVVADLHLPFTKDGYLEHCKATYKKYKCNKVIFIGDMIDNHYSSYHETDPDGYSAGYELEVATKELRRWYKAFPKADVVIGNHDRIIMRKMFTAGLSKKWLRTFADVLGTPNWVYRESFLYDGVLYTHGEGGSNLYNYVLNNRYNVVIGHFHTKAEIVYNASKKDLLWGMAVGCGIDIDKYAFAYAHKNVKRPIITCGVVLDNGSLPILIPIDYKK